MSEQDGVFEEVVQEVRAFIKRWGLDWEVLVDPPEFRESEFFRTAVVLADSVTLSDLEYIQALLDDADADSEVKVTAHGDRVAVVVHVPPLENE